MAETVGVVGLGIMGAAMARNLARAGFRVVAWNRTRKPELDELGATLVDTPADVGREAPVVLTMVTDAAGLDAVSRGEHGFYETLAAQPEPLHLSMETIGGANTRRQADVAASRGIALLGAPVSGGSVGAAKGTLSIMASGPRTLFDRCVPFFHAVGDPEKLSYCGPEVTQGPDIKLDNNLNLLDGMVTVYLSCMGAVQSGIDPKVALKVFLDSTGDSIAMRGRGYLPGAVANNPVDHGFVPGYKLKDGLKDLNLWAEKARRQGLPTGRVQHTIDLYVEAVRLGYGELDVSAILNVLLARAGLPVLETAAV